MRASLPSASQPVPTHWVVWDCTLGSVIADGGVPGGWVPCSSSGLTRVAFRDGSPVQFTTTETFIKGLDVCA
jgi:hypothetical protein